MRLIDRPRPSKTGLTASALVCALVLVAAGILTTQAGSLPDTPGHRAAPAVAGDWRVVSAAPVGGQRINALLVDRAGRVWAGAEERGLAVWDGTAWYGLTTRDGLPDNRVLSLFEDRQGRVWAATGTGIGYASPEATALATPDETKPEEAASEALDGAAVAGPEGAGPEEPDGAGHPAMVFRRLDVTGLPSLPVLAFAEGADGAIYMGTGSGLVRWQEDRGIEPVAEFAGLRVNALHTRGDGTLWAGTASGLWRLQGDKWAPITADDSPAASRIRGIVESPEEMLYVWAEDREIWRSRGVAWQQVELPAAFAKDITAIGLAEGRLWLGTHEGVWANEASIWRQYDARLLPGPAAAAFASSPDGSLWIGTGGGLVEYRPERTAPTVEIVLVNGIKSGEGAVELGRGRIEQLEVAGSDRETPPERLAFFTQLDGVDDVPQVRDGRTITAYRDRRLAAGRTVLHVWAEDEAFNRSAPADVMLVTPGLIYLPFGLAVRKEVAYPILAAIALLLVAAATIWAGITARRRAVERAAAAEAARVQAVVARGFNPYHGATTESRSIEARLPEGPAQEVAQTLDGGNVLLLGEKGMGKTPTLRRAAGVLSTQWAGDLISIPAYLNLSSARPDTLLHTLMGRVAAGAEPLVVGEQPRLRWHEASPDAYSTREFHADLQILLASLQPVVAPRQIRFVLLLDEAQSLDGYPPRAAENIRGLLVRTMGGQLRAVLAGERAPRIIGDLKDLFRQVDLKPLSDATARELVVEPVLGVYTWTPDAVDLAVREAAGRPERLLEIAAASVQHALADGRIDITANDTARAVSSDAAAGR